MQKRNIKRVFSLLLCMVVLLWPMNEWAVICANASEAVHYNISDGNVIISSDGDYIITGESEAYTIEIEAGVNANITLDHVSVTTDSASLKSPFKIADNSTGNVVITLEGENKLTCNSVDHAALQKNGNGEGIGSLTIKGTGSLTAMGGGEAAGIGGGSYGASTSNIIISSGMVTAIGGYWAAGIGGASGGSGDNITISGGVVKASGGNLGAGIGGGSVGGGSNITISGGMVEAVGGTEAAGIGGGNRASGSNILINGGIVAAEADGRDAIDGADGQANWSGIIFQNGEGFIYGESLELTSNVTISEENTLTIKQDQTLTISEGTILSVAGTVTNNGTIRNNGEINIIGEGSMSGNVPQKKAEEIAFDKTNLSLLIGESVVLTAITVPEETFEAVTWNCDNEEIVALNVNGKRAELNAKKAGKAAITAKVGEFSVTCDVAVSKLKGTAAVSVEDIYCGKNPVVEMKSTNGIENAVVEYISLDKDGAVYTEDIPKSYGKYRVKVSFPETEKYTAVEATADFQIIYLPTAIPSYEMSGTKGKNGFYISPVTLTPTSGYQISDKLDEGYGSSLIFKASKENANVYLMNAQGEKTDAIHIGIIKIDTEPPYIEANDKTVFYADKVEIGVSDGNLSKILINGSQVNFTGAYVKVTLGANNGKKEYQITATDLAGNEKTVNITVAAPWMKDRVMPSGMYVRLMRSQAYMLGSGQWQVNGDTTTYMGAQEFYVGSEGEYIFTTQ